MPVVEGGREGMLVPAGESNELSFFKLSDPNFLKELMPSHPSFLVA